MSIGKYFTLLISPNLACNACTARSFAVWSSVTLTTKLSVDPATVAPARFVLEIPGFVTSTVVPLLRFELLPELPFDEEPPPLEEPPVLLLFPDVFEEEVLPVL